MIGVVAEMDPFKPHLLDGTGLERLGRFDHRRRGILQDKDAFGGGIGLEEAGDHRGQRLGGGEGCGCNKGKKYDAHRILDAACCQIGCGRDDQNAGEVDKEGRHRRDRLAVEASNRERPALIS